MRARPPYRRGGQALLLVVTVSATACAAVGDGSTAQTQPRVVAGTKASASTTAAEPNPQVATPVTESPERETVRYLDQPWVSLKAMAINQDKPAPSHGRRWEVLTADVTLAKTLERWARIAGYRLQWDAARNFLISAPSSFEDLEFPAAVAQVLSSPGIRLSEYPLEVCIYANTPPLVRVTRVGEQTQDCAAATR